MSDTTQELVKLSLNSLYGKMTISTNPERNKPGSMLVGSAIANYAANRRGLYLVDTDAIYCDADT